MPFATESTKIHPLSSLMPQVWINKCGFIARRRCRCPYSQMVGSSQRTFSKHSLSTTAGSFHPGVICPHSQRIWNDFLPLSFIPCDLTLPSAFSSEAVWMCKCYLYIVCTLVFAKRSFCSVASQPWQAREHHRQKKKPSICFLCSLSEVSSVQGWGLLEIFWGIYFGGISRL